MLVVVSGVGAAAPRARRSDLAAALDGRPAPPARVSQLAKVEREVTLSIGNAYDLHTRLLPHLREIATARLERRGQRPGPDTLGRGGTPSGPAGACRALCARHSRGHPA